MQCLQRFYFIIVQIVCSGTLGSLSSFYHFSHLKERVPPKQVLDGWGGGGGEGAWQVLHI